MTPFFQASQRSLAYQFTTNVPLMCPPPPFSIFRKFCIFSLVLAKISALKTQNFQNFRSQDPLFFKENTLPRPYFWKPVWHIPTKKKVECPPQGGSHSGPQWQLPAVTGHSGKCQFVLPFWSRLAITPGNCQTGPKVQLPYWALSWLWIQCLNQCTIARMATTGNCQSGARVAKICCVCYWGYTTCISPANWGFVHHSIFIIIHTSPVA